MAKDSRSTFPIIDDNGCPVDPTIFPRYLVNQINKIGSYLFSPFRFTPEGTALQSVYEAFRFTESYGVIFQCNVKYCLGPCEPVSFILLFFRSLLGFADVRCFYLGTHFVLLFP